MLYSYVEGVNLAVFSELAMFVHGKASSVTQPCFKCSCFYDARFTTPSMK